jgi:hypothetical protein
MPPREHELEQLRAFLREVRRALAQEPNGPGGGSPEGALLHIRHRLVALDGAAPPPEKREPDPTLNDLGPGDA